MKGKVLVTYASRTGYTAGVAEAIGKTLTETGLQVDVLPMQQVRDLESYKAFIVGSAIQAGQWLPEAMQFMRTNEAVLRSKPLAAFLVCMTLAMPKGESYRSGVAKWMEPVRKIVRPVSEGFFAGALELKKVPSFSDRLKFRISILMGVWTEGDHRDWNTIHNWASELKYILNR